MKRSKSGTKKYVRFAVVLKFKLEVFTFSQRKTTGNTMFVRKGTLYQLIPF